MVIRQSSRSLTQRESVERALRGGHGDRVPFTIYEYAIKRSATERELRNRGMCIVDRRPVVAVHTPNVKTRQEVYWENSRQMTRTVYETPVGTLSTLGEADGVTVWGREKMFKGPEDYKALRFLIEDETYSPDYEAFTEAERTWGGDAICRSGFGLEPLQALISGIYMDMTTFCLEWMDRQDEVLKLYDALVEKRRQMYPLVARSPALHSNYGGNVVAAITGPELFEKYYLPHYQEAAEIMHKHGKLIGCHYDGNCRALAPLIARTDLDYIEAFTPAPDTDMTLGAARAAWPDKALWLNFPSSVHLKDDHAVEQDTIGLLDELRSVDGLIVGITEDMPPWRGLNSCRAIMDGLGRHAEANPGLYA
ncbi:MAG: hypothetical protein PHR35_08885 [Kiritimatiellae bacterium]|nr:hypothetical protein [Kiritimatiellia bacterium]